MLPALRWAGLVLILDIVTKHLVMSTMTPNQSMAVWPGILHLTYVRNPGAAYGLLAGNRWLLAAAAIAVVIAALVYVRHVHRPLEMLAIGFLIGGASGNLLDRLRWGLVTDLIEIKPLPIFRVFNVADISISAAAVLLVWLAVARAGTGDG